MRISNKGLIDRSSPVSFTFDGKKVDGFAGDTVASAALAQGRKVFGRSFKYHRPRGVMTTGSEEPNALVTLHSGAAQDPNIRATTQEIYDGLQVRGQNAWPSVDRDLMGVNDLFAPFFGAGFYYKTFMWPGALWEKLWEPMIRRAAGLGALSGEHDTSRNEKAYAFCDLLVIGAGPAGLMAALTAARAGADVILADEDARFGGRLLLEDEEIDGKPGHIWASEVTAELEGMDNVRLMTRTTVTGVFDQGTYGALERVGQHLADPADDLPRECFWRIVAKRAVLAAGALERSVAFANNDRPGIMMAGAVRGYLNRYGVATGQKVAIFGNNDSAWKTARDLQAAGVEITALIDSRSDVTPQGDFPVITGGLVSDTRGHGALKEITVQSASGEQKIAVDCLGVSGGWNPSVHMLCHMNGRPAWDEATQSFLPVENMVPGLVAVGSAAGHFNTQAALESGINEANKALTDIGLKSTDTKAPQAEDGAYNITALWDVPHESKGYKRAWLDYQNDVSTKDVRLAAKENYASVEHMKRYTTQGMAPDQGKNSNVNALAILADATGRDIPTTGTTTFRPPYVPVSMAALGAGARGKGFAPERFVTSHQATVDRNAPMIEAGLWYRPGYYPRPGEKTWLESCNREVTSIRNAVGVTDVSTLGKIDIQGPDAGAFLDFVYTNMFSTLKVGRVRYGLMLREDGHVMDDGTTARLGENHYVTTTTTAAAGQVMKHMEFVHQALCPDLNVRFISVTEQWAQFAVAGPKSRELLNTVLDDKIDNDSWPFMACGDVTLSGVKGRLFRISFSGEHAYEIAVPSRYGDALFRDLVSRAEVLGGGAYGMEALNVLRIEKGFITHAEIHGRVTAFDIGMGRMVSGKKDCIGKTASERPGLHGDHREHMVGLKPVDAGQDLSNGAHLFFADDDITADNSRGYVTSVGYSPTLDTYLALGFLENGPAHYGKKIRFKDHLRGIDTMVEVCNPVFLDPEGGRSRG
ncbi:sarcosine oxidase subunit alpha family protein [Thalassobius sp. I31.1]|uniref:sarcosine oxidase subunit alpha family protein n=1 Tax=Thalassobius sp. I31.1 TaxID=2109912 RepID=UPI000D1B8BD2|nr:sarcosine oxidase subunit alpha family protein [Thalassobius sp. I31.1]